MCYFDHKKDGCYISITTFSGRWAGEYQTFSQFQSTNNLAFEYNLNVLNFHNLLRLTDELGGLAGMVLVLVVETGLTGMHLK